MDDFDVRAHDSASGDTPGTLAYYARLVARRWWIPLSFLVLGVSLAFLYTGLQKVAYEARSTILLSPLDPGTADELPRLAPTVARLVRSDAVLLDARQAYLGARAGEARSAVSLGDLRSRTNVGVPRDTSLFEVTARGRTQRDANRLVRTVVAAATRQIARLGGAQGGRSGGTAQLRVAVLGRPIPTGKVSPTPARNFVLGANLGVLLGIAAALLVRDPLRARVRADLLARLLDASNLVYAPLPPSRMVGQLARVGARTVENGSGGRHTEGIRLLGGRLSQWFQQERREVLLLGDLAPETLRSVALRLAGHLARTGLDPVVVEADFHGSGWRTGMGDQPYGLGDALEETGDDREPDLVEVQTSSQNGDGPSVVKLVPRGNAHGDPALLLGSERYRSLIGRFVSSDNVVLVVGPPTEFQAEVVALADWADAIVLLVPPWIARSHVASMTTLRSIGENTRLLVSVFGEPEAVPLGGDLERARGAPQR